MSDSRPQLDGLTGLRGIAAWLVVFYHVRSGAGDWLPSPIMAAFAKGYLAVDLFFVLSGFVIWLNYAPFFEARGWSGYGQFLQKRLARIWPLHGFVLMAMIALALAMAVTQRHNAALFHWSELPLHFLLMQNWGLTPDLSWNHPAWSISTEFAAYLVFPLFVLGARFGRWPGLALVCGVVALAGLLWLILTMAGAANLGDDIARFGLIRCLIEFAIGTMICQIWLQSQARADVTALTGFGAALVVMLGWIIGLLSEVVAFPLIVAPLILALAHSDGKSWNLLRSRLLVWLGEISYSTYLIHFAGWFAFKLVFVRDAAHVSLWQVLVYMVCVLVGSMLCYRFVEKPGRVWMGGLTFGRSAHTESI